MLKTGKCIQATIASKFNFNISLAATNLSTNLESFVFFKSLLLDAHNFLQIPNSSERKHMLLTSSHVNTIYIKMVLVEKAEYLVTGVRTELAYY